jgi:hypothetical protein
MDHEVRLGVNDHSHPYVEFEGTALWVMIDEAVSALVENGDVEEITLHSYIVGYLCQALARALAPSPPE